MFHRSTDTQTVSATQHNTCVAIQENAAQQQWYKKILVVNPISNTGKLATMAHPDFWVNILVEIFITQSQKIDDHR